MFGHFIWPFLHHDSRTLVTGDLIKLGSKVMKYGFSLISCWSVLLLILKDLALINLILNIPHGSFVRVWVTACRRKYDAAASHRISLVTIKGYCPKALWWFFPCTLLTTTQHSGKATERVGEVSSFVYGIRGHQRSLKSVLPNLPFLLWIFLVLK